MKRILKAISAILAIILLISSISPNALALRPAAYQVAGQSQGERMPESVYSKVSPPAEITDSKKSMTILDRLKKPGWYLSFVALGAALVAVYLYPAIAVEFIPVLVQGLIVLGALVVTDIYIKKYIFKVGIMLALMELLLRYFSASSIVYISDNFLIRILSVLAAATISKFIFTRDSVVEKIKSSLGWVFASGMIMGYYLYHVFHPFLSYSFSEHRFGAWAPILKSSFNLTIVNYLVIMWMMIALGAVFGEGASLKSELFKVVKTFKNFYPINFIVWFTVGTIMWRFMPDASVFMYGHAGFVILWQGFFTEYVRRSFSSDEAELPAKNDIGRTRPAGHPAADGNGNELLRSLKQDRPFHGQVMVDDIHFPKSGSTGITSLGLQLQFSTQA